MSAGQDYINKKINECINARVDVRKARDKIAHDSRQGVAAPDYGCLQKAILREHRAMTDLDIAIDLMAQAVG